MPKTAQVTSPASLLQSRQVGGCCGAEVTGVDLATELDPAVRAELWSALLKYRVLFFRDQTLDHAQHVSFTRQFGPLTRRPQPHLGAHPEGFPEILSIDPHAEDPRYGADFEERYRQRWTTYTAGWHSDLTPALNPPAASVLRADTVPDFGGDTQWTDMAAAYAGLSPSLRAFIDGLQAEHVFFAGCLMSQYEAEDRAVLDKNLNYPLGSIHPIVRVHPETGERALFVNPASTLRIVGMSPIESRHILDLLFEHMISAEYTVRFRWEPGSVAMWDNRSTAHLAATDLSHLNVARVMYRVTLLGDVPVGPDGFVSTPIRGERFLPLPDRQFSAS